MGGHGGTGGGFDDLLKVRGQLQDLLPHGLHRLRGAAGVGDEHPVLVDVVPTTQPVVGILQHHLVDGAAILLAGGHFAVLHFDAGLQLQQVSAEGAEGRTATALVQIVQPVDDEAGLHLGSQVRAGLLDLLRRLSGGGQLRPVEHQQTLAGGEVPGIHHIHLADVRRRDAGVLVGAGHQLSSLPCTYHALSQMKHPPQPSSQMHLHVVSPARMTYYFHCINSLYLQSNDN